MGELLAQLGVNFSALFSQGLNFLLLLALLTWAVYRPLLRVMRERKEKIEFGLKGAEEADRRLRGIDIERKKILVQADVSALTIIHAAEEKGHVKHDAIVADAKTHAQEIIKEAEHVAKAREKEEFVRLEREARGLMRAALAHAVSVRPDAIDDALIDEGVRVFSRT